MGSDLLNIFISRAWVSVDRNITTKDKIHVIIFFLLLHVATLLEKSAIILENFASTAEELFSETIKVFYIHKMLSFYLVITISRHEGYAKFTCNC